MCVCTTMCVVRLRVDIVQTRVRIRIQCMCVYNPWTWTYTQTTRMCIGTLTVLCSQRKRFGERMGGREGERERVERAK